MTTQLFPVTYFDWEVEARAPRPRQAAVLTEQVVTVGRTNGNGFQTTGAAWLNFSRFAKPEDVQMPTVGDTVTAYLDKAGFVRRIAPAARPAPVPAEAAPAHPPAALPIAPPADVEPASVEPVSFVGRIEQDVRGIVVSRLACMNTATAILSSGGRATSPAEVLALAAHLEAWATR